ncbi:hypothetical protein [Candidatus Microthrix parvicella]|jgi:hypothetical protein|uniref:hypothetical protein n=1 Tax=Candidatus Neomicrothrix parvicella TaxID=41950 RepID=UPI00035D3FF1|nr:hypothetical protein [Candidatus Microthrix parvicella]
MKMHEHRHAIWATTLVVTVALLAAGCGCSPAPVKPKAEGSGCSGLTTGIPAGTWYGAVKSSSTTGKLSFDVECLYVGPSARAAAIEDGRDPTDIFDFYIRNASTKARSVPVCSGAKAFAPSAADIDIIKQLSVGDYLKHVKGTLNNPSIYSYGGLTKLTVRSNGACATTMTQIYLP